MRTKGFRGFRFGGGKWLKRVAFFGLIAALVYIVFKKVRTEGFVTPLPMSGTSANNPSTATNNPSTAPATGITVGTVGMSGSPSTPSCPSMGPGTNPYTYDSTTKMCKAIPVCPPPGQGMPVPSVSSGVCTVTPTSGVR